MIIRLSGLPGSGKTTIGQALSEQFGYRLFRIDHYRETYRDEFQVMIHLFQDMMEEQDNFILDSTGFNMRTHWVFQFIKARVVDVKLLCNKGTLLERLEMKRGDLPANEYFPYRTGSREQFVEDYYFDMLYKPADLVVDTTHLTKEAAIRCVIDQLNFYTKEAV